MEDTTMNNGNAADTGEKRQEGENGNVTEQRSSLDDSHRGREPQTVPYSRFQEVNAKRKAAEDALAGIVEELCADVPEEMRDLIPNLPATEKVKWLRDARSKGLFGGQHTSSSPDSKRPIGKTPEDLSTLSPVAMMSRGYNG